MVVRRHADSSLKTTYETEKVSEVVASIGENTEYLGIGSENNHFNPFDYKGRKF